MNSLIKAAMSSLKVICKEDGYELHSPAGSAIYDKWGVRGKVDGVPEFFPSHIAVEEKQKPSRVTQIKVNLNLDTTDAQKALDDIQKVINDGSQAFESFQERVRKETTSITWSGSLKLGINRDIDALIDNAVASNAESERIKEAMEEAARKSAADAVATVLKDFQTRGPLRRALGI